MRRIQPEPFWRNLENRCSFKYSRGDFECHRIHALQLAGLHRPNQSERDIVGSMELHDCSELHFLPEDEQGLLEKPHADPKQHPVHNDARARPLSRTSKSD